MSTYILRKGSPATTRVDLVVVGVHSGAAPEAAAGGEEVASAYGRSFKPMLSAMGVKGTAEEAVRVPTGGALRAAQLLLVGLGPKGSLTSETVRRAAGVAARNLGNATSVALALPTEDAEHVRAVTEGFLSGLYTFRGERSRPAKRPRTGTGAGEDAPVEPRSVSEVVVLTEGARRREFVTAFERAQTVAELVATTRDWVNTPPGRLRPPDFADAVVELGRTLQGRRQKPAVETEVLGPEELRELGCGGILGVAAGSASEPRLVRLRYAPEDARAHIALVGKGITYDSGGLSIKSGSSMADMKFDMAGAATVLTATHAIAALGLPVAVTAYAPMAENMPSGSAMRPGDVLTMHDGQTVEVSNTDAEGRLVLADAMAMAVEDRPDVLIDVATLTGACIVALGDRVAGVFGDDATTAAVLAAAASSGEQLWRLPIPEQQRELVSTGSRIADVLQHRFERWGSASFAAAFLERFSGGLPWAHLDIAGPAWNGSGAWGYVPPGGTGFGLTTLVEYAARLAEG